MGIPLLSPGTMADDVLSTIRLDSVLSALNHSLMRNGATGMGTGLDPYTQVEVGYGRLLNEHQLRALYRGSWFIRRVVDLLPMDMTKSGVEVQLHDGSNARIVAKAMQVYHDGGQRENPYEKRIGCNEARRLALTYARWFGMGYIVLRVNGGEDPSKPLTKVKSFEGVSVLDRYSLRPAMGTVDIHNPEYYQISRYDSPGGFGSGELPIMQRIHASRVLVYRGARIHPYDIQLEGDGGHDSVVQQVYEAFARHFMAKDAISKGLDSYSLFKVAISGLSTLLQSPNGTETLTTYLNTVAQQMSLHRIVVQDTEASKSEFQERSFAGVAENFKFFVDDLIAATGYPHYKIYGSVGKAGLADSGGAESRAWAETVNAYQSMELSDNDRVLFHAIFESVGRVPKQWEVVYPSIYSSTPEEEANLNKVKGDFLSALTREGIITTRQAYQSLATGQPLENVLEPLADEDVLTPVEEDAAQGPSAEEELAALLGGDAPAPVEPETVEDAPAEAETAEDVPEDVAVDEPLPDAVDAPLEESLEEDDEVATEVEAEVVPDDEPEPLSAEDEMVALLAEEEQQTDAADTFTPPDSARANAQRVIDWREQHGEEVEGMTAVGWTRARQLASGEPISLDTVKRMAQFNRHRQNYEKARARQKEEGGNPWEYAGIVAWLGWGGSTGVDWAIGVSAKADAWDDHADADDILEYLVGWRADAPKGGKKKRTTKPKCTKGRSCGMSCIPQNRKCKADLSPAADVVAKSVASSGGAGGGKGQGGNQDPFSPQVNPVNIPDAPKATPQAKAASAAPTLKGNANWNPDAKPDLTPGQFRSYVDAKYRLKDQENPSAAHNMSWADYKAANPRATKGAYQSAIKDAIRLQRYVPSDAALQDIKLTKAEQGLLAKNRTDMDALPALVADMERAINAPILPAGDAGWKASMSREEASEYLKDTFFGTTEFYHGNRRSITDDIAGEGAKPWLNDKGIYGQGTYFGVDRTIGELYAKVASQNGAIDAGLVTSGIKANNPYVVSSADFDALSASFPGSQSNNSDSAAVTAFLRAKGYDSAYLTDLGYGVAFDQRQVVTMQSEQLSQSQLDKIVIDPSRSASSYADNNSNAQQLKGAASPVIQGDDPGDLGWRSLGDFADYDPANPDGFEGF